jgi:putative DNA primase/helicase
MITNNKTVTNEGNIPLTLKQLPQWVNWKYEQDKDGKTTKIPKNPNTLNNASSNNPTTWTTFEQALKNVDRTDGIGLVISNNDSFAGIDLDHCRNSQTGEIKPWAKAIIDQVGSYTEVSPSGEGIRIFVEAKLPDGRRKSGDTEAYDKGRFFTVTGNSLNGNSIAKWDGTKLHDLLFGKDEAKVTKGTDTFIYHNENETLLQRMFSAENGDKVKHLWQGDHSAHPSQSEADMALASHLYFWTGSRDEVDKLFRQSGLYRQKWDDKHYGSGKTYGEEILDTVCTRETYKAAPKIQRENIHKEEVEELTRDEEILPIIDFPLHVFSERFLAVISEIANSLHVELSLISSAMLTVISGAIGNTVRVTPKQGYDVALFIWLILIAPTGHGKSPAINTILKHIKQLQGKEYNEYEEQMRTYQNSISQAKHEKGTRIFEKPKLKAYYVSDCTIEALANVFDSDGRGVVSFQDEIAGLILGLNQYKGSKGNDSQHILELFNAYSWKIDRKSGIKFIKNTGASIIGGIQPKVMPTVFNHNCFDDGMISRFLLFNAGLRDSRFSRQGINENTMQYWHSLLDWCYGIPLEKDEEGFIKSRALPLGESALNTWEAFYNELGALELFLSDRAKVFVPKLTAYYSLKFAGVLHCINAFENKVSIKSSINNECVGHAIDLTKFFAGQAVRALRLYSGSEESLNEYQKRFIRTLHTLQGDVKNGKLALSRLHETFNAGLPVGVKHTPEKVRTILRRFDLTTTLSGGYSFLIWETEKINKLFRKTSTSSTTSTNDLCKLSENVEVVEEVEDNSEVNDLTGNGMEIICKEVCILTKGQAELCERVKPCPKYSEGGRK